MKAIPRRILEQVALAIVNQPTSNYHVIAAEFGLSHWMVCKVAKAFGLRRQRGSGGPAFPKKQPVVVPNV